MDGFVPKSLEELERAFCAARASATQEKPREEQNITEGSASHTADGAKKAEENCAKKESLLPKPMLYKAAPMQSPVTGAGKEIEETGAFSLQRGKAEDDFRINVAPPVIPVAEKPKKKRNNKQGKKRKSKAFRTVFATVFSLLAAGVIFAVSLLSYASLALDNAGKTLCGYYLCSVTEETRVPYIARGAVAFVKKTKTADYKKGVLAAYRDHTSDCYRYGYIKSHYTDNAHNGILFDVVAEDGKGEVQTEQVTEFTVLGSVQYTFPAVGDVLQFVTAHRGLILGVAALLILLLILLLVAVLRA